MPYVTQLQKYKQHLKDMGDFLLEHADVLEKYSDATKDPYEKIKLETLSMLCSIQGIERRITFSQIEDLTTLFDLIEKLPKSPEFDEIKEALQKTNDRVKETLEPIKEAYDKASEFEKRMKESGIYA
ncbi:MAG TPA: hypothetical protein VJ771_04345 [Candidatus Nitrosotalea sp.]|nr:hypothetical protein [Candidatus Nitrosotalea sp.]